MSKLTREDVLKLAELSKIRLTDDEVERFSKELPAIVDYVEQIDSADVKNLKPTDQVTGLKNVMREDEIVDYMAGADDLLENVPEREDRYIKVKRIIE